MSHIVKGQIQTAFTDTDRFRECLAAHGNVLEDAPLYREMVGYTKENYPLVLEDKQTPEHRIGFRFEGGVWRPYEEQYGNVGAWTRRIKRDITDLYIAKHYEAELVKEGFQTSVTRNPNGSYVIEAEEVAW